MCSRCSCAPADVFSVVGASSSSSSSFSSSFSSSDESGCLRLGCWPALEAFLPFAFLSRALCCFVDVSLLVVSFPFPPFPAPRAVRAWGGGGRRRSPTNCCPVEVVEIDLLLQLLNALGHSLLTAIRHRQLLALLLGLRLGQNSLQAHSLHRHMTTCVSIHHVRVDTERLYKFMRRRSIPAARPCTP